MQDDGVTRRDVLGQLDGTRDGAVSRLAATTA
jgi:hypothetical protein